MKNSIKFKTLICLSLMLFMLIGACKQNETQTSTTKASTSIEKPSMDIHAAILSENMEVVKQHIKAGSDLNKKDAMSGSSPLITASTFNKVDIASALINANADLSIKNNDGATALHTAAFFGRIEIVQLLIDAKADKTIKNNYGATPRETVMGDFAQMKPIYEMMIVQLEPMGFNLDLEKLEAARPVIAMMLQ
ncbi:ankyrin repeat domain-containing protein [Winogradskyella sp.]|uniref:ankyrin repeat domain-containing protein n=1 Tax=Winogradskyella sp. TaxID=1883156 RepID=UPI003BA93D07